MHSYQQHNAEAWNRLAARRQAFTRPARDEQFERPLEQLDGRGWLGGNVRGQRVLCLASGGGRQSALFAAAGAVVTVVDISSAMLALDRQVAAERGYDVRTVEASMDDLSMLEAESFDIVYQPVSTCYVPDVRRVYAQVARVIVPEGIYISQHKQPGSLQAAPAPTGRGYELTIPYYWQGPLPEAEPGLRHREPDTLEFLHRLEDLLGGLCQAGFVIEDVVEPLHADSRAEPGTFKHRSQYVAPYLRIKARRRATSARGNTGRQTSRVWLP